MDEKSIELSQLELGGNKMGVREINYLGDFVTSYPPLVSIVSSLYFSLDLGDLFKSICHCPLS